MPFATGQCRIAHSASLNLASLLLGVVGLVVAAELSMAESQPVVMAEAALPAVSGDPRTTPASPGLANAPSSSVSIGTVHVRSIPLDMSKLTPSAFGDWDDKRL